MDLKDEFQIKLEKMKKYMEKSGLDGLALSRVDNFAWATCGGRCHVNIAQDAGVASFLLTGDKARVVTTNIERGRLLEEELGELPVEVAHTQWQESRFDYMMEKFIKDRNVASDMPLGSLPELAPDFLELQYELTVTELIRYRSLGARSGQAIQETCKALEPGMSETQIAGLLAKTCLEKGVEPIVTLVATDSRISSYRHPLPDERKKLDKIAMVVLCGRRKGLIASCTRMVSFGEPDEATQEKFGACAFVDVVMNMGTTPGRPIADIFESARDAYWQADFAQEWNNHHQGGPTGYRTRYFLATEKSEGIVKPNMAFAWNPSITGVKSEDTVLVLDDHNEMITQAPDWPVIELEGPDMTIERPDILVL